MFEKIVSLEVFGEEFVLGDILWEFVSLVDWFMVFVGVSDILYNDIDVGGIEIDDLYFLEVFYLVDCE